MRDAPPPEVFVVVAGGLRGRGGIGHLVAATVDHWRRHDMEPRLRIVDTYGPRLSAATPLYLAGALAQIVRHARRRRILLLHVHMAKHGSMLRKGVVVAVAARLGVPVLLHLHGSRLDEVHAQLSRRGRRLLRRTLASAQCIVAPGSYWRDVLVEQVGIDPSIVRVIANAAPGPAEMPRRPTRARCELVFLGNLSAHKGLPDLLAALADPRLTDCDWRLRVAGAGDPARYVRRAQALGIDARTEFIGWLAGPAVSALLADADVFVLPTYNEGLSIALLEAMAHGCAVVTTPVGATPDALSDGHSALLVPPADVPRLAEAVHRVIRDVDLRAALQAAARRRWEAGFDIATHCRQVQHLYRAMLGEASHAHHHQDTKTPGELEGRAAPK